MTDELNCGKLIEMLSEFPKDKPVKILALGNEDDYDSEEIDCVSYPNTWYDDCGEDVFVEDTSWVGIFTKEYNDNMLMNGV